MSVGGNKFTKVVSILLLWLGNSSVEDPAAKPVYSQDEPRQISRVVSKYQLLRKPVLVTVSCCYKLGPGLESLGVGVGHRLWSLQYYLEIQAS